MKRETKQFLFFLFAGIIASNLSLSTAARPHANANTFNVRSFGARANDQTDDSRAFMEAWKAACGSHGNVKLIIPPGTYLVGPAQFSGPCKNVASLTIFSQGTLKATTDLHTYTKSAWLHFGGVNRLNLIGGTFDGQGHSAWPFNQCPKKMKCKVLPTSIMFVNTTDTIVRGITSINSKFFHIGILGCINFNGSYIDIRAPENSPNTDGIHLERNSGVSLSTLVIGTGDDCVSIGQGNKDISLTRVICGPGHGISIGSLGKYKEETDVKNVVVRNSVIKHTMNGIRIKTWQNSPTATIAANMSFNNIILHNVSHPILIDQEYCPYTNCETSSPSKVMISNITFKNIRGTSRDTNAVMFRCSKAMPCKDVNLHDVDLKSGIRKKGITSILNDGLTSTCINVKPTFHGIQHPPPCH